MQAPFSVTGLATGIRLAMPLPSGMMERIFHRNGMQFLIVKFGDAASHQIFSIREIQFHIEKFIYNLLFYMD
jgi:hypothetical protein